NNAHDGAPAPPAPQAHRSSAAAANTPPPTAPSPAMPKVHLSAPTGDVVVSVEIVSTEAQIERGLMYREHLPPDQGMLFLMSEEKNWPFWMHNTLIPLDIMYIAGDMTVVGIVRSEERRVGKGCRW